jgi:hypothetical protein
LGFGILWVTLVCRLVSLGLAVRAYYFVAALN